MTCAFSSVSAVCAIATQQTHLQVFVKFHLTVHVRVDLAQNLVQLLARNVRFAEALNVCAIFSYGLGIFCVFVMTTNFAGCMFWGIAEMFVLENVRDLVRCDCVC